MGASRPRIVVAVAAVAAVVTIPSAYAGSLEEVHPLAARPSPPTDVTIEGPSDLWFVELASPPTWTCVPALARVPAAAWMPRPSPHGRVDGVPRESLPPGQARLLTFTVNQPPRGAAPFAGTYFAGDIHMSMTALNTSVPARSRTLTVTGSA